MADPFGWEDVETYIDAMAAGKDELHVFVGGFATHPEAAVDGGAIEDFNLHHGSFHGTLLIYFIGKIDGFLYRERASE